MNQHAIIALTTIWFFIGMYIVHEYLDLEDRIAEMHPFFSPIIYTLATFGWPFTLIVSYRL
jgi:hypothetical protein